MNRGTDSVREQARLLLAQEMARVPGSTVGEAAGRAIARLVQRLSTMLSTVGTASLFRRAVHLAGAEYPFLLTTNGGDVHKLDEVLSQIQADEATKAIEELLAQMMGLVVRFLGEDLALRTIRQAVREDSPVTLRTPAERNIHDDSE